MARRFIDPDPVVGYALVNWAWDRVEAVALTPDRIKAKGLLYNLAGGPYTSGDIDVRAVRKSDIPVEERPASWGR